VYICETSHASSTDLSAEEWAANWRTYWFPSMCEPSRAALEFWDTEAIIGQHEAALADLVDRIRSQPTMDIREVLASNPLVQTQPAPIRSFEEAMQAIEQSSPVQIGTPFESPLLSEHMQQAIAAGAVSRATVNSMVNAAAATDRQAAVQNLVADVANSMRIDSQAAGNEVPNSYIQVTGGTITGLQAATPRPEFTGRVIQSTIRWDITNGQVCHSSHISELTNLLANSIPVPAGRDPNAASEVTVRPVDVHETLSKLYDRSAGPSLFDLAIIAAYRQLNPVADVPVVADHARIVQLRRINDR